MMQSLGTLVLDDDSGGGDGGNEDDEEDITWSNKVSTLHELYVEQLSNVITHYWNSKM